MGIDGDIVDYSAALFLRYFRSGAAVAGETPRLNYQRDVDLLKGHWAVSGPVRALIAYVLAHPHEAQSLLTFQIRVDDAMARGRINARRTWLYRLQSGLPTAIVAEEPVRSFNTGPNLILAWVLREASAYTARLSTWQGSSSPYLPLIEQAQQNMRAVQRIEALREPLRTVSLGQRPGAGAIRSAARARQPMYQLALQAYLLLQALERGDPDALNSVARSALIAPLEDWRRFELAVGLAAGEALAQAGGLPLQLHLLGGASADPIITVGPFALHWQQKTDLFKQPDLEPSERLTADILKTFGLSLGTERPDFIVINRNLGQVVAVIEVKYLAGDTANARFREAVDQVVRYARGYTEKGENGPLVARSLVALSHGAPVLIKVTAIAPASTDFAGIIRGELASWADRLIHQS